MQDFSGASIIHLLLMSASMISWRSKLSMLPHGQETISTLLWDCGAAASDGLIKLSKREEYRNILDYPRLTFSALRKPVLSGVSNDISIKIDNLYSIAYYFSSTWLILALCLLLIHHSFSHTYLFAPPKPELLLLFHLDIST